MTMHIVRGMNSVRNKKPSFKMTKAKLAEWQADHVKDNKWRKQQGMSKISFEEYCDNRLGKVAKPKTKFTTLKVDNNVSYLEQHRNMYPSHPMTGAADTSKRESPVYSGERKLLGIATMHKSNMVPVFSNDEAVELARMRRG